MGYLLSGLLAFHKLHSDVEIHVFELDVNKLTPFTFSPTFFTYYRKSDYKNFDSFKDVCISIDPSLIIVSGRSDSHYLKLARYFKKNRLTVSIQDSQDDNSFRTFIKSLMAPFLYHPYFTCIWASGAYGISLAFKMKYRKENIYNYSLSADTETFCVNPEMLEKKNYRTILYVGRFSDEKNIRSFLNVFRKVNQGLTHKWKVKLVGNGELINQISDFQEAEIYPFQSADQLKQLASECDVFCLPSYYEPWGIVVHEFSALGKALLISTECGSSHQFLIDGFNGFSFNPYNIAEWEVKMEVLFSLTDDQLFQMQQNSIYISQLVSPKLWAAQLYALYNRSLQTIQRNN
jgi:glycosyltransferase involved in cell wall biosynthesis